MKDYDLIDLDIPKKYTHPAVRWYLKNHIALMDGTVFDQEKPAKNFKERVGLVQREFVKESKNTGKTVDAMLDDLGDKSIEFSIKIE